MAVETICEDDRWREAGLEAAARLAARAALARLGLAADGFDLCVLGCDDMRIAALNDTHRGAPRPTNVLSWPSADRAADGAGDTPAAPAPGELGDIAIAFDTCAREAAAQGKPFDAHVTHLLVHGVLHLLGYDHIDARDAALMERLEVEILETLGVPDPY